MPTRKHFLLDMYLDRFYELCDEAGVGNPEKYGVKELPHNVAKMFAVLLAETEKPEKIGFREETLFLLDKIRNEIGFR